MYISRCVAGAFSLLVFSSVVQAKSPEFVPEKRKVADVKNRTIKVKKFVEPSEFPELMTYHEIMSLTPMKREEYLRGLQLILVEMSQRSRAGFGTLVADGGIESLMNPDEFASSERQYSAMLAMFNAIIPSAFADYVAYPKIYSGVATRDCQTKRDGEEIIDVGGGKTVCVASGSISGQTGNIKLRIKSAYQNQNSASAPKTESVAPQTQPQPQSQSTHPLINALGTPPEAKPLIKEFGPKEPKNIAPPDAFSNPELKATAKPSGEAKPAAVAPSAPDASVFQTGTSGWDKSSVGAAKPASVAGAPAAGGTPAAGTPAAAAPAADAIKSSIPEVCGEIMLMCEKRAVSNGKREKKFEEQNSGSLDSFRKESIEGKADGCISSGNMSKYKGSEVKAGNCGLVNKFCMNVEDEECLGKDKYQAGESRQAREKAAKEKNPDKAEAEKPAKPNTTRYKCKSGAICNPLIFGAMKDGSGVCVPSAGTDLTVKCHHKAEDLKKANKGDYDADILKKDISGVANAWDDYVDQFNKLCKNGSRSQLAHCEECAIIGKRLKDLNRTVGGACDKAKNMTQLGNSPSGSSTPAGSGDGAGKKD